MWRKLKSYLLIQICLFVFLVLACENTPTAPESPNIKMVHIPVGSFQRNDVSVTVSAFQVGKYEVTQAQYQAVLGNNPSFFSGDLQRPVERVNWDDAVKFCNKLSKLAGLDSCYNLTTRACDFTRNGYRLPTEAEWEYACRAGTTTEYYTGDNESDLAEAGWYEVNSDTTTHAVGGKQPNAFGLYDMHGNVWEWCNDRYGLYSDSTRTDPTGPSTGVSRVLRGGTWGHPAVMCRSASRSNSDPDDWQRSFNIGFRVARR